MVIMLGRTKSCLHNLKVVILARKTKNVLGGKKKKEKISDKKKLENKKLKALFEEVNVKNHM